jgi:hypothetical protein
MPAATANGTAARRGAIIGHLELFIYGRTVLVCDLIEGGELLHTAI